MILCTPYKKQSRDQILYRGLVLCFLLASTVAEYREQVLLSLRQDSPNFLLGVLIGSLGLAAIFPLTLRRRAPDRTLLWFGIFALLYGMRLVFDTAVVPFLLAISADAANWIRLTITYFLPVPAILLAKAVVPAWRKVLRWLLWFSTAFAALGIGSDILLHRPGTLHTANNVITLVIWAGFAIAFVRYARTHLVSPSLQWGLSIFGAGLAVGNLRGLGLLAFPFDPEPLGFACFLIVLGRALVLRTLSNEERLGEIEKELEIATRIQLSILPREMPQVAGLQVAVSYLPMTAVAGDFYDFLLVDQHRVGILIADVSGHGVPAALIASMVKVAIAAQLAHADNPAQVLTGMNQILCGKMQGQFVSAAYLFLNLEEGKLRYAAAGHPPLLWWKAGDRQIEALEQNGLLLGIMSRAPYSSVERTVYPGDRFLLYTDGLVEGANPADVFFGEERVRETLAVTSASTARECAETLLRQLATFAGHDKGRTQDDDLTVIVIDICPAPLS